MNPLQHFDRRQVLQRSASVATAVPLGLYSALVEAAQRQEASVLAPKATHYRPKAKQLLLVFLTGGFSHMDTFDHKPKLKADHGKDFRYGVQPVKLKGSQFQFQPYGQSGTMVSELFPHVGGVIDDLCLIRSMHTDHTNHSEATLAMHTGSTTVPMPGIGAWISYGLGTFNPNLPSYTVIVKDKPFAGSLVWDSKFLPGQHQGVPIIPGGKPIPHLKSPVKSIRLQELEALMLQTINARHQGRRATDRQLRDRTNSFRMATGLMREAPEVFDLSQETKTTRHMYGLVEGDSQSLAWQCLVARRLIERGVRIVQVIDSGAFPNWDSHGDMDEHRTMAAKIDQPLAALVKDLKQRGMLEDTLVVCCTEFGRTPWAGLSSAKGRDHHPYAFTCWLAGAGIKPGANYGGTDEYGLKIVENPVHVHDFHATILHLMGMDHTQLTYRYAGRDFRLTDVHGNVVTGVLS